MLAITEVDPAFLKQKGVWFLVMTSHYCYFIENFDIVGFVGFLVILKVLAPAKIIDMPLLKFASLGN